MFGIVRRGRGLLLLAVCAVSACSWLGERPPAPIVGPLVGKIYRAADQQAISREALREAWLQADIIYLAEQHENSEHHRLQREVIAELVAAGRKPALALEAASFDQSSALLTYSGMGGDQHGASAALAEQILRERLQWGEAEDYYWRHYGAIVALAREQQLTLVGMDLPKSLRYRISKFGVDGLNAVEQSLLSPSGFVNEQYRAMMMEQFKAAHCGYGEEQYLSKLYDNWVARNDRMATTIVQLAQLEDQRPVVVIVGSGHTRYGQAVVERVGALAPELKQLNIGLQEIRQAGDQAADYLPPPASAQPPDYDYYWFTRGEPPAQDHCAGFLKHRAAKDRQTAAAQ